MENLHVSGSVCLCGYCHHCKGQRPNSKGGKVKITNNLDILGFNPLLQEAVTKRLALLESRGEELLFDIHITQITRVWITFSKNIESGIHLL